MRSFIQVELELRGRECFAETEVYWKLKHCECTSTYGDDKNCTERWDEVEIECVDICAVKVLNDAEDTELDWLKEEDINGTLFPLTKEELRLIRDLAGEQLMEEDII